MREFAKMDDSSIISNDFNEALLTFSFKPRGDSSKTWRKPQGVSGIYYEHFYMTHCCLVHFPLIDFLSDMHLNKHLCNKY